jgi:hypothetical protein
MRKIYILAAALMAATSAFSQNIIYSNTFESGAGDATIVGTGVIKEVDKPGFGKVFHNAVGGEGVRTNYLLLPENVFTLLQESGSKELTIAFWINKAESTAPQWTPAFTAYGAAPINGANTWPMLALQTRLVAQVNCTGWSDFTDAQNVAGVNKVSIEYLADLDWHYYVATFTETALKIYIDGVLQNQWNLDGSVGSSVSGLFTNGSDLKYICLGGNQAWNWGDVDAAYMYDDVTIYSAALTEAQISANITAKPMQTSVKPSQNNQGEVVSETYYSISGKKVADAYSVLTPGIYIKKTVYSNGTTQSTKIVKSQKQ